MNVVDNILLDKCDLIEGTRVFTATDSGWEDVVAIAQGKGGRVVAVCGLLSTTDSAPTVTAWRIVDADENVLQERYDTMRYAGGASIRPRWLPFDVLVLAGARLQAQVYSTSTAGKLQGIIYMLPEGADLDGPTISIFGDGKHPGDPEVVAHASVCNALRRMREELEEEL